MRRATKAAFVLAYLFLAIATRSVSAESLPDDSPSGLYENARERMTVGDYGGAVVQLKRILQIDSGHLPARLLLGEAYLREGNSPAAEDEFMLALKRGADRYEVFHGLGNVLLLELKYKELLDLLDDGNATDSQHFEIRTLRGRAHYELGDLAAADREFRAAHELAPQRPEPLLGMALVAGAQGSDADVEKFINQAIEVAPNDAEAWYQHAEALRAKGDFDESLASFSKSLTLNSQNMRAHIARANLYIVRGEYAKAREDVAIVRKTVPQDTEAAFLLWQIALFERDKDAAQKLRGETLGLLSSLPQSIVYKQPSLLRIAGLTSLANRDYSRALAYLEHYVELRPNDYQMRKVLGEAQMTTGDSRAAVGTFFFLSKILRRDPSVFASLGRAHIRLHQYNEATSDYETAVKLAPTDKTLATALAVSRLGAGDVTSAVGVLSPAIDGHFTDPESGVLFTLLQLKRGELLSAEKAIKGLNETFPKSPFILNVYGVVCLKRGDTKGARARFEEAIASDPTYLAASYNLAELEFREYGAPEATKRLKDILAKDPRFVSALNLLSEIATVNGDYEGAIGWAQKASSVESNSPEQLNKLIQLYLTVGRTEDALLAAKSLANKENAGSESALMVARVQRAAGKPKDAIRSLQLATGESGLDGSLLLRIASEEVALSDYDGARQSIKKAIAAGEKEVALPALARLEIAAGNYQEAERRIEILRELKLSGGIADLLSGALFRQQGKTAEALGSYRAAFAEAPSADAVLGIYEAQSALGKPEAAIASLESWRKTHQNDISVNRTLALGYIAVGELDKARDLHEEVLREYPGDATLMVNLARILQLQKRPGARSYAENALRLRPDWPVALDTLGWILAGQGDLRGGLVHLREAIARGANPLTRLHVAEVLVELGRMEEAKVELTQLLQSTAPPSLRADAQKLYDSLKTGS